ncbi:TPR-like protein [Dioscorea alata]|uniref:TPR-like protein n=1 Tax=Dioscorea alata TaxID=55571 RepID=A0ACB7VAH4_DIOAL|nr:TPR-like protein [Dioscorea alata]
MALKLHPNITFIPSPPPPPPRFLFLRSIRALNAPPSSPSPSPLFLPHLHVQPHESPQREHKLFDEKPEPKELPLAPNNGEEDEEDEAFDPIRVFFQSRTSPVADPKTEGRLSLQRNRRTTWHLADFDPVEEELTLNSDPEIDPSSSPTMSICGEILQLARNLPENTTLGDFLGSYAGKIGEGECIELLRTMGEEGLVLSCLYLFEWMGLQEPSLVTPRSYSVLFPVLGTAGMGEKLMILFENLPRGKRFQDVHVYNAAISGLSSCGRYDDAWKVYETLEANNVRPDHVTCSILITVMRKRGDCAKDAWNFFERMNRKGVKWSLEVCGALIKSFCDEGLKKEALIVQSEMENKGIASNAIIYNTLMNAFGKCNQIEEVEGLFTEMKNKEIKPTTATYNVLMDAYSRRMQPEIIENLLLEMQDSGLKPNVKSYTCLISAYGRQRKMSEKAADAFLRMKKAGIKPTSHSYTALIHAYSVSRWHEKAYAAFENMQREGIKPSIETYTALLDAFRRAGDTQMLMEIWKSMISNKVKGTRVTFNIIVDGLAKHGLYAQARDVIFEFEKLGLPPTAMTYNMLMNAYARGGQHNRLPQLLKEMAADDLKPDSVTYSTMIYAFVRVRDFNRAFFYHKQMVKSGQVPDARSYQKLRAILDAKAKTKNRRDRSAILGMINSKMGIKPKKGKKDEFWKTRRRPSLINKLNVDRGSSS